ncbi:tetratricopeptide repeat protein [Allorhodopirellula heiligendammensis]|uniref:Doubled CXXCH motif n=1 Tax=Allorhodopirellula heiligendammensis TaxID=2714739 RepID=A0A5C6BYB3_9BACT|nr:tetratricopeptide repeat protein [Allorhodopirellula heiligendammensis]TWU16667.1 Doubled CXXCH motif [Allorhodopirellula heiligendammensis]
MTIVGAGCGPKKLVDRHTSQLFRWQDSLSKSDPKAVAKGNSRDWEILPEGSIGSDACVECHRPQVEAFKRTAHGNSMRRIQPEDLPPPGHFRKGDSSRIYEAEIIATGMQHRESVLSAQGTPLAENSLEVGLEIGSGAHAHTYLGQQDGYWIESPLTWYHESVGWELSPGFDGDDTAMFDRTVTTTCVFCHAGQIRADVARANQFAVSHASISCERCHGSGADHVAAERGDEKIDPMKRTIVHPGEIPRAEREAICSQCHLQGIVSSSSSNFDRWDFRPGKLLSDNVTEYQLRGDQETFRIVGHTEQLHRSECFLQTEELSCVTCHDPHPTTVTAIVYREICLGCHTSPSTKCAVPEIVRIETQHDQCATCHMPKRSTNVTHAALHDHRIAVHDRSYVLAKQSIPPSESSSVADSPQLVAISSTNRLDNTERDRRRLLALHSLATSGDLPKTMEDEYRIAQRELVELFQSGVTDASVRTTLANTYLAAEQWQVAEKLAQSVIRSEPVGSHTYIGAADVLARHALRTQDNQAAISWYHQLTQMRRVSGDHFMLGVCELNANQTQSAILAFEQALRIDATLVIAHEYLAQALRAADEIERCHLHEQVARELRTLAHD